MLLAHILGAGHRPVGHEHEQMRPVGEHVFVQLAARFANRRRRHDPIEPTVEVIETVLQGGVLQRLASSTDGDGPQQQPAERRAERRIAALDGVFGIAEQMRQRDLPQDAMAALAAEHIGDPNLGADGAEQRGDHRLARAGLDHMQRRRGADEHPLPPVLAFDPHRGLVGADHRATEHAKEGKRPVLDV
jgi:hypothetical protein